MIRLKELRKEKKLTQEELARDIGVSKITILRWENGERQIKPDKAQRLADYFGVSVGYLLGYDDITKVNVTDVETFKLFEKVADEQKKEFGLKEITDIEQLKELKSDALIAL